jgi:hypothetical protein
MESLQFRRMLSPIAVGMEATLDRRDTRESEKKRAFEERE